MFFKKSFPASRPGQYCGQSENDAAEYNGIRWLEMLVRHASIPVNRFIAYIVPAQEYAVASALEIFTGIAADNLVVSSAFNP